MNQSLEGLYLSAALHLHSSPLEAPGLWASRLAGTLPGPQKGCDLYREKCVTGKSQVWTLSPHPGSFLEYQGILSYPAQS